MSSEEGLRLETPQAFLHTPGWELVESGLCVEGMADPAFVLVGSWVWAWKALRQAHQYE